MRKLPAVVGEKPRTWSPVYTPIFSIPTVTPKASDAAWIAFRSVACARAGALAAQSAAVAQRPRRLRTALFQRKIEGSENEVGREAVEFLVDQIGDLFNQPRFHLLG